MFEEFKLENGLSWTTINIDDLTEQVICDISEKLDLNQETIDYALDKNERAHTEYDSDNKSLTLTYNALNKHKDSRYHKTTSPMTFLVRKNQVITFYNQENVYIIDLLRSGKYWQSMKTSYQFLFLSLFFISEAYFPYVEKLDRDKDEINRNLRDKTTKKGLFALSDIETNIVYLVSAANQNALVLEQLKGKKFYQCLNEIEKEQLEDTVIEAQQLSGMTTITARVLEQLSGTYNNILNNNLNDNMTTLTIISILLASLAVITGFFGMNVPLPMTGNPYAWVIIIGGSVLIWLIYAAVLRYIIRNR